MAGEFLGDHTYVDGRMNREDVLFLSVWEKRSTSGERLHFTPSVRPHRQNPRADTSHSQLSRSLLIPQVQTQPWGVAHVDPRIERSSDGLA